MTWLALQIPAIIISVYICFTQFENIHNLESALRNFGIPKMRANLEIAWPHHALSRMHNEALHSWS